MFYIDFYKETNTISSYLICHLQDSTASKDVPNISEEEKKKIEEELNMLKQRKQEKLERQKEKEKRMYVYISDYPTLYGKNIIPCWREGYILHMYKLFWCLCIVISKLSATCICSITGLLFRVRNENLISYFSIKTYAVGTQKNRLN